MDENEIADFRLWILDSRCMIQDFRFEIKAMYVIPAKAGIQSHVDEHAASVIAAEAGIHFSDEKFRYLNRTWEGSTIS